MIEDYIGGVPILGPLSRIGIAARQRDSGIAERDALMKRRKAGEFDYHTPDEIYRNLNLAKNNFLSGKLPGQDAAENKLESNTSSAIGLARSVGRSPSDIIAGIVGANANQNAGFNDIATKAADYHSKALTGYEGMLDTLANYKDKEWAYNEYMPYMDDRRYAEDLIGAGNQNINSAQNDFGSQAVGLATMGLNPAGGGGTNIYDLLNNIFSKKDPKK